MAFSIHVLPHIEERYLMSNFLDHFGLEIHRHAYYRTSADKFHHITYDESFYCYFLFLRTTQVPLDTIVKRYFHHSIILLTSVTYLFNIALIYFFTNGDTPKSYQMLYINRPALRSWWNV